MPIAASGPGALPLAFHQREVVDVARDLLGRVLVARVDGTTLRLRIFETEAYHQDERGCHAFGGRRTPRTRPMFELGGRTYVYFVYGMHWQFNVVTGQRGSAQAALVRCGLPLGDASALELVRLRRGFDRPGRRIPRSVADDPMRWCDGPAKVCQALGLCGAHGDLPLETASGVWVEAGSPVQDARVARLPRVGIAYAGADAGLPWRFRADLRS